MKKAMRETIKQFEIKFYDKNGKYQSINANYGFEYNTDFCNIKVLRQGQQYPETGNDVEVSVTVTTAGEIIPFSIPFFGEMLEAYCWNEHSTGAFIAQKIFTSSTWRDAFEQAKQYVEKELDRYCSYVKQREQALLDAEL